VNYCIWHVVCDMLTWCDMCMGWGVRTTWRQRATGVIKMSEMRANARSRVYKSGNSRRNIRGARGDQGTADWVLCSSGVRKEVKLTCMLGVAWAGSSGLCQEGFQASCHDLDTSWMLTSQYQVCLKCWKGFLGCWGFADTATGRILEGLKGEVKISSQMANMEQGKWF